MTRLTGSGSDPMKVFGAWKETDLRGAVDEYREEFENDFEDRQNTPS